MKLFEAIRVTPDAEMAIEGKEDVQNDKDEHCNKGNIHELPLCHTSFTK